MQLRERLRNVEIRWTRCRNRRAAEVAIFRPFRQRMARPIDRLLKVGGGWVDPLSVAEQYVRLVPAPDSQQTIDQVAQPFRHMEISACLAPVKASRAGGTRFSEQRSTTTRPTLGPGALHRPPNFLLVVNITSMPLALKSCISCGILESSPPAPRASYTLPAARIHERWHGVLRPHWRLKQQDIWGPSVWPRSICAGMRPC
jgi:hypothetical protein